MSFAKSVGKVVGSASKYTGSAAEGFSIASGLLNFDSSGAAISFS